MEKEKRFNGSEGAKIDLKKAARWTKRYRDENPKEVKGHFYGCDKLYALLQENGCKGIRIYYAIDDDGNKKLVLAGAKSDRNNILPSTDGKGDGDDFLLDDGLGCPDYCPIDPDDPLTGP